MRIKAIFDGDRVHLYHNDKRLGSTTYEAFCLKLLSPKQFERFEKNPDREYWDVRKIDVSHALFTWSTWQPPF